MKKLILLILVAASAHTSERMYGIYSSLEVNPDSGDIGGMEVLIFHDGRPGQCSDSALVQVAEGWVQMPALVDCCHCSNESVEFQFAIEKEQLKLLKKDEKGSIEFFGFFNRIR